MGFALFSNTKEKNTVAFLIDSGSVTGLFVVTTSGAAMPRVTRSVRTEYKIERKLRRNMSEDPMVQALDATLSRLLAGGGSVDHVRIIFSVPWAVSATRPVHLMHEKPFVLTHQFIGEVSLAEEKEFKKNIAADKDRDEEFDMIERHVLDVRLNGYAIREFIGKRTAALDMHIYLSAAPRRIIEAVRASVLSHTHLSPREISFSTLPLAAFSVFQKAYTVFDYLLMTLEPEATVISLIKAGILFKTVSFPSGINQLVRQTEKMLGVSPEIALSDLHMAASGMTDERLAADISSAVATVEKEWAIYFEDAFNTLGDAAREGDGPIRLPDMMYIAGPSNVGQMYIDFLKMEKADVTSAWRQTASISCMSYDRFASLCSFDSRVPANPLAAAAAIFSTMQA